MDLIKTGIGITKTIRNVSRLREIVVIFAKHGFDEFISGSVTQLIPDFVLPKSKRSIKEELEEDKTKDWGDVIGFRLRKCFEELGPAFVKFGQLLSSREDIFDESFIDQMKILRDQVKPVPFDEAVKTINESLGEPWKNVFLEIDPHPIGTASIGVVFKGKLLDGTKVVIKVRRPNIEKEMLTDFSIMKYVSSQIEKVSEEIRFLGISRIVHDFSISLQNELNFNIEALNSEKLKKNLDSHGASELFYIPKVYKELSSEKMLVMEQLIGTPFSEAEKLDDHTSLIQPKLQEGLNVFIKTFLNDGFFHADLHGGNFFYLENGMIGLIDFGLMGHLSKKGRENFIAIIYSLLSFNYENLVFEFLDVAEYEKVPDVDILISDVRDSLSPFVGLTVQQTNFTIVLRSVITTLRKHEIFLPREWFIVFRALITLDGVGKNLKMDIDLFSLMENDIYEIVKNSFKKEDLAEEAIWLGRDLLSSSKVLPRHMKWFLKDWAKKGYAFEVVHKGHEKQFDQVTHAILFLSNSLLVSVFFAAGVYLVGSGDIEHFTDIPMITYVLWFLSFVLFVRGFAISRKA
ncbi:AarF/ABC1/UbiB kinase family protein [Halobacteriovorax sp. HLS]|uniref:ABC1 kinase family protein n=1 Tax=Halobacteriovorax sp. HLS TaxID=2234000 RepID=UPI000FD7A2C5|nr:AarF/UbiB family protein [Halobacteriovorax sp. HLS]